MRIKFIIAVSVAFIVAGCADKNLEYYTGNIDEAESTVAECKKALEEAFASQDRKQLEEISKNPDCVFATQAVKEHKRNMAILEQELKEEEFKKKHSEQLAALKKLSYLEFYKIKEECGINYFTEKTVKCKAYSDLRTEMDIAEIDVLKKKYSEGELEGFRDKSCKGMAYEEAYCALATVAANQQQEERVEFYLKNRDELKRVFNACHETYIRLRKSGKRKEASISVKTYQCSLAGKAAAKLRIYSFRKPIE